MLHFTRNTQTPTCLAILTRCCARVVLALSADELPRQRIRLTSLLVSETTVVVSTKVRLFVNLTNSRVIRPSHWLFVLPQAHEARGGARSVAAALAAVPAAAALVLAAGPAALGGVLGDRDGEARAVVVLRGATAARGGWHEGRAERGGRRGAGDRAGASPARARAIGKQAWRGQRARAAAHWAKTPIFGYK